MSESSPAPIEWATPPPPIAGRKASIMTDQIVSAVRDRPGEWALIFKNASSSKSSAVRGYVARHPEFEMTSRTVTKAPAPLAFDVYLRYVGEGVIQ